MTLLRLGTSLLLCILLSSCMNLFGFVDKPKGDEQILSAARACLDRGDFQCAREHYQALSTNYNDTKISELAITTLAENQVFSMEDLINSMGSNRGGGNSFAKMAEYIASRGKATRASRVLISEVYQTASGIVNAPLRSYVEFISSLAMLGAVLGVAVGGDQILSATDIVQSGSCIYANCSLNPASCGVGTGAGLTNASTVATDMAVTSDWDTANATLGQLLGAANSAQAKLGELSSSTDSGLFAAIVLLGSLPGQAPCIRQQLIEILFP